MVSLLDPEILLFPSRNLHSLNVATTNNPHFEVRVKYHIKHSRILYYNNFKIFMDVKFFMDLT